MCMSVVCVGDMCVCGVSVSVGWSCCRGSLPGGLRVWLRMLLALVCIPEEPLWGPDEGVSLDVVVEGSGVGALCVPECVRSLGGLDSLWYILGLLGKCIRTCVLVFEHHMSV